MWRARRAKVAKICAYAVGGGNLALLAFGPSTAVTLGLAAVLAPFTLSMVLQLTAFLACGALSLALCARQDRGELLICAIGAVQPPVEGEKYRETMIADIRDPTLHDMRGFVVNLLTTAPRTILEAWFRFVKRRRSSIQRPVP